MALVFALVVSSERLLAPRPTHPSRLFQGSKSSQGSSLVSYPAPQSECEEERISLWARSPHRVPSPLVFPSLPALSPIHIAASVIRTRFPEFLFLGTNPR